MTKSLFQMHRPKCWDELVGHERHKSAIRNMQRRGSLGGRAFWISGPSGIGKTSMAYLIAVDVCDPENFLEIDAGELTPKGIDDLERQCRCRAIGNMSGRAVLINEAHGLRRDSIRKLLVALERIPSHVTWVFTTTAAGQQSLFDDIDSHPLISRCIQFESAVSDCSLQIIDRALEIAQQEGLGGASRAEFQKLARNCQFNFREMLTHIEAGRMKRDVVAMADSTPAAYDLQAIHKMVAGIT